MHLKISLLLYYHNYSFNCFDVTTGNLLLTELLIKSCKCSLFALPGYCFEHKPGQHVISISFGSYQHIGVLVNVISNTDFTNQFLQ